MAIHDNGVTNVIVVSPKVNSMAIGSQFKLSIVNMLQSANTSTSNVNIVSMNPEDIFDPYHIANHLDQVLLLLACKEKVN
jgi:hypothetical protein